MPENGVLNELHHLVTMFFGLSLAFDDELFVGSPLVLQLFRETGAIQEDGKPRNAQSI
jgi:hypothetical protein